MGIKIYTYSNPYDLCHEVYWNEIKNCPHFCVSQTMVNGFEDIIPSLKNNGYLTTMRILINALYEDWENINTRVRQIMEVDNAIHCLAIDEGHNNIRNSLEYNTKSIAQSIRLFKELGLEADSFDVSKLNPVQNYLVDIYRNISRRSSSSFTFYRVQNENGINAGIMNALKEKHKNHTYADINIDTIVIHGIHQFSPSMLCAIEDILKYKNVVLLFNYQEQYSQIYQTWLNIYSLFDCKIMISREHEFKPVSLFIDSYPSNTLADNIGILSNGDFNINVGVLNKLEVIEFENLTEFAGYCALLFENAKRTNKRNGGYSPVIYDMTEQLYSASGKVNDILKAYFPEQFGERHFLDYPIGHFFVAIIEMWDNDNKCVKVNEMSLIKDCLSSGIISEKMYGQLLNTFNTVESYIEKESTLVGIIKSLKKLRKYVGSDDEQFKRIGYLNCSKAELDDLRTALTELNSIIIGFFEDFSVDGDNFNRFYRRLHDFIVKKTKDMDSLDEEMKEVITKLLDRMNTIDLPDTGTFNCLKQTMSFYLSQDDSLMHGANWIVRDFEQIDGDVLRSLHQKSEKTCYHFCCLSDKDICASKDERLPWPLDIEFFENSYEPLDRKYQIFLKSKMEFRNFKRYALLYGLEFNRIGCKLSYVKSENRKENELYHLIKLMGIKVKKYHNDTENNYVPFLKYTNEAETFEPVFTYTDQLRYAICPYRFVLESLVQGKTIYRERFLIIFYFRIMLENAIRKKHAGLRIADDDLQGIVDEEYQVIDDKFHISNEYEKTQIISEMYRYLKDIVRKEKKLPAVNSKFSKRLDRKNDFLVNDLKEFESVASEIDLLKIISEDKKYKENPGNICLYCSSKDVCLKKLH